MRRWLQRTMIGGAFAVPLMLLTGAAMAGPNPAVPVADTGQLTAGDLTCRACHQDTHSAWAEGSHGHAADSEAYLAEWESRGKPNECLACHTTGYDPDSNTFLAEGVTCEACHGPAPADHPNEPMPSERSGALCGSCHTETLFEWQVSKHREVNLACVACHDPHATAMKGTLEETDESTLCATCHRERASNFAHSSHSQVGLSCADCHLGPTDTLAGEGHAVRDHSFNVRLTTCNACHAYQMHDPVEVHPDRPTPTPIVVGPTGQIPAGMDALLVSSEPSPVSPIGFAALSGLVGMATGMILAPWLERFYHRVRREDEPGG
ncbi:MAG TPA: cytochrome c3 family protein [Anaerolineales bacterium]|nr:cytochrome c3 family protein [Anaerolineales bacterium]